MASSGAGGAINVPLTYRLRLVAYTIVRGWLEAVKNGTSSRSAASQLGRRRAMAA